MSVNPINSLSVLGKTQNGVNSTTLGQIQENPQFFPLLMAQMTNNNINNLLFYSANPGEELNSSSTDTLFSLPGSTTYGSDPLMSMGNFSGSIVPDTTTFSMNTYGLNSFFNPTSSLESYEVTETLRSLMLYSDISETQRWLGQSVTYLDPADNLEKTGVVTQVNIENIQEPTFTIDGKKIKLSELVSLNS